MRRFVHPMSGVVFESQDDDTVLVTDVEGRTGVFDRTGRWLSGEVRFADAHACEFVAGPPRTAPV